MDRFYQGPDVSTQLIQVLGRAAILVCTECGVALHVLDVEAHSLNCRATPRFPLPSQVGYHADSQSQQQQQLQHHHRLHLPDALAIADAAAAAELPVRQKRKYRSRIKKEAEAHPFESPR